MKIKKLINKIEERFAKRNSQSYIKYLRKLGIKIGNNTFIRDPRSFTIDHSRPASISIGNNVRFNLNTSIIAHDAAAKVFRTVYNDYLPSNGRIVIGNNIWFGRNVCVLKGSTIGDNCIVGFGSTIMGNIPSNSVVAGTPARVICTLDEYYKRRKEKALEESLEYARSIKERFSRRPEPKDFFESFVFFVDGDKVGLYPEIPIKYQLGPAFEHYRKYHKAPYSSFDEFLKAAGIE